MGKVQNWIISKTAKALRAVAGEDTLVDILNKFEVVQRFGKMLELKIDRGKKEIFLSALLKGEMQPTEICVEQFEVVREGDCVSVRVKAASSNRAWISALLNLIVLNKNWVVPEDYVIFFNDFLE